MIEEQSGGWENPPGSRSREEHRPPPPPPPPSSPSTPLSLLFPSDGVWRGRIWALSWLEGRSSAAWLWHSSLNTFHPDAAKCTNWPGLRFHGQFSTCWRLEWKHAQTVCLGTGLEPRIVEEPFAFLPTEIWERQKKTKRSRRQETEWQCKTAQHWRSSAGVTTVNL